MPFYITGESYAGHYVPAFAHRIFLGNKDASNVHINLRGIGIGNGLVDPQVQYAQYAPFAKDRGIVNAATYDIMEVGLPACLWLISECAQNSTLGWLACYNAYVECNIVEVEPIQMSGLNVYDIREKCNPDLPLCYNFTLVDAFLKKPDVIAALGVAGHTWADCNRVVDLELVLAGDWMLNFDDKLNDLLANDINVLVYSGEDDFICNWYGGHAWTHALKWPGQAAFNAAANTTWHVDGQVAGTATSAKGLTFLRVKDAGHMVPMDQPVHALAMLRNLFARGPWN